MSDWARLAYGKEHKVIEFLSEELARIEYEQKKKGNSMGNLANIRAAIVASVRAIPNMGVVHERERYVRDEQAFKTLYLWQPDAAKPAQLRGWWLRRTATAERSINIARHMVVHSWELRGYMAFADADATELTLDELIEAWRDAVRSNPTFDGACQVGPIEGGDNSDGVQLVQAGPVMFCGVLCHSAVLQLRTWSYV